MIEFDKFVVLNKDALKKLNIAVDKVIYEKLTMDLDYVLMENALGKMIRNVKNIEEKSLTMLTPIKKEHMLKIVLNFFKSIDKDVYRKAIDTILNKSDNIRLKIYNVHEIKDFDEEDEVGMMMYTRNGNIECRNGASLVNIPMRYSIKPEEENILSKD